MPQSASKIGFVVAGILFFIAGGITWLNATLVPYLKLACELSNFQAYLVPFAFYVSFAVATAFSAQLLQKIGIKSCMVLGLMIATAGIFIFIPAALMRSCLLFLIGLAGAGAGISLVQISNIQNVTINTTGNTPKQAFLLSICSKLGGILSTLALGLILFQSIESLEISLTMVEGISRAAELDMLARRAVAPYLIVAALMLLLTLMVKYLPLPIKNEFEERHTSTAQTSRSYFWLNAFLLFLLVGTESITMNSIALYGRSLGIAFEFAILLPPATLLISTICYIAIYKIVNKKLISQQKALTICATLGVIFTLISLHTSHIAAISFIALLGLANALTLVIVLETLLKTTASTGAGTISIAMLGGAALPLLYGHLADSIGAGQAYYLLVPCYALIIVLTLKKQEKSYQSPKFLLPN